MEEKSAMEDARTPTLPDLWQKTTTSNSTQYYKVEKATNGVCQVTLSVIIYPDLTLSVYVHDKEVPKSCALLKKLETGALSANDVSTLIRTVDQAILCPGHPEEVYVTNCQKRGEVKGGRGAGEAVGYVDNSPVSDRKGQCYPLTVRRIDCNLFYQCDGARPVRCKSCLSLRSTLRSSLFRQRNSRDTTGSSSHTKYTTLTPAEKDKRMRNLHHSFRMAKKHVGRMKARIKKLLDDQAVSLQEDDAADISPVVNRKFPDDSPQRVFWEQQLKHNSLKGKRQMRWHPLVISTAPKTLVYNRVRCCKRDNYNVVYISLQVYVYNGG